MDWSLLTDFLAIARAGSLSGAATALGVNHSTIYRTRDAGKSWTAVWFDDPRFETGVR